MFAISAFKSKGHELEYQLNKLTTGGVGLLSVFIVSEVLIFLPKGTIIDTIGSWIFKVMFTCLVLFAIGDTYEGQTKGIKTLAFSTLAVILFIIIEKISA